MTDHVVIDVEIQKPIDTLPKSWDSTELMGVSVAVVWEFQNGGRFLIYGPDDVAALQERLLRADRISGYNIFNFDFPVIWAVPKRDWMELRSGLKTTLLAKTDDILRRIWQAKGLDPDNFVGKTHGGLKLDDVAYHTIAKKKLADGAIAPVWFQQGKIHKLIEYCIEDVAIERDLGLFLDVNGFVGTSGGAVKVPKWKPEGGSGSAAPETPLADPVPELEEEAPRFQFKGGRRPEGV